MLVVLLFPKIKDETIRGCRFVPEKHVRKRSSDGTKRDVNIGEKPGFGGLFDFSDQIYNPEI